MNQQCKVCGEPAAGFHFGAFTCEGCKSFFGRTYNNLSSISECKNNGECVINKKNRTACKACRLRKCLLVGMSKSGSRYGRRSNWFKIHCLLQEQQHKGTNSLPTSPAAMMSNNFMPSHFLTNLCNSNSKHDERRIARSPTASDSGASSADPDESNREGSIESFVESKTEKSSSSPQHFEQHFRPNTMSPYFLPTPNGRLSAFLPISHQLSVSSIIYSPTLVTTKMTTNSTTTTATAHTAAAPAASINEQEEPMDLTIKSRKRQRSPSPAISVVSFDRPKPTPLDLTLVRSRPLSG